MKFAVDFEGWIEVEAKDAEEAQDIFWNWVCDVQDYALGHYKKKILRSPRIEYDGVEKIEEL